MTEGARRFRPNMTSFLQESQVGVKRDSAQSHYHLRIPKQGEFPLKIRAAGQNLKRERFVVWRDTANRAGDVGVGQLQTVIY